MKDFIKNIVHIQKKSPYLSYSQILYLLATDEGLVSIKLKDEELIELINLKAVSGNKLTSLGKSLIEAKVEKSNNPKLPILSEDTGKICKALAKHFMYGLDENQIKKYKNYTDNNVIIPFLQLFFNMFPTSNNKANKKWESHFNAKWSNVTLRKITQGSVNKLNEIWNNKDIGLFLLGTYLFIQNSFNEEKGVYYIKKMENYFREYDHWYQEALDALNGGELEYITKRNYKSESTNKNTTLI